MFLFYLTVTSWPSGNEYLEYKKGTRKNSPVSKIYLRLFVVPDIRQRHHYSDNYLERLKSLKI